MQTLILFSFSALISNRLLHRGDLISPLNHCRADRNLSSASPPSLHTHSPSPLFSSPPPRISFTLLARKPIIFAHPPFSRSVILWCKDVRVDSTLPRCSVSFRSPGFPSSMLFTRDNTCFSKSSILLWSRSLRLFACTELLLLLNCCQGRK